MTAFTLFPVSPLSQMLGMVMNAIPVASNTGRNKPPRSLPAVLPTLFDAKAGHAEQLEFLDEHAHAAVAYIKSLTFLKHLQYMEEEIVFPVWCSASGQKNHRRGIKKLVRLITNKDLRHHRLVTNDFLSTEYLAQKHEWARSALSLMLDFGLIRLYRQRIYQDGIDFPIAVDAVRELYFRRLEHLDLSEKAWCDEGMALDEEGRDTANKDLRRLFAKLEKSLCAQAKEDADLLIRYIDKPVGVVKRLAIENHFFQCYRELFIKSGITAPRFSWQLKSNLSKALAEKLIADFA